MARHFPNNNVSNAAVAQSRGESPFENVRQFDRVGHLGPQIRVAFLVRVFVEIESKRVQILIAGPVDSAAIRQIQHVVGV